MPGTLYVVATPIGNLDDLTARAGAVLAKVSAIAAEDTRRARILLDRLGVGTRPTSLPAFDERGRADGLLEPVVAGADLALITDAGTPGISDPGGALVARAVELGITVIPIPGPCAAVTAISASGLAADRFCFLGFLPRKGGGREALLERMKEVPVARVIYESPHRLRETLLDLAEAWGDQRAVVARELTKLHEELIRGTLRTIAAGLPTEVLGEVVIVVEGPIERPEAADPQALDLELRRLLADGSRSIKDIARELAEQLGRPRKEIYARALELAGKKG
jgi:16S rRNA (cytidine1402-2'-O)-methyltransferase